MTKTLRCFFKDESGATAIEYAIIAAVLGAVIITAMGTLGSSLKTTFGNIGTKLTTSTTGL
ncbi:Flp family type IVb pilin [Antarcticirhabdus aurantiaca]|uniref:Flp family type IVb pilin n=1 Tax=Antarcticirhabdus aurantiaca TaxID=2606717 RepID=A0ACD4NTS2_9HYPH|nr:Flp family type IVb pilin [Antarcticirhabdus aurantiaca]WAJ30124.1 Flp family type IVb pilin [Jeongeuplla avenae]